MRKLISFFKTPSNKYYNNNNFVYYICLIIWYYCLCNTSWITRLRPYVVFFLRQILNSIPTRILYGGLSWFECISVLVYFNSRSNGVSISIALCNNSTLRGNQVTDWIYHLVYFQHGLSYLFSKLFWNL